MSDRLLLDFDAFFLEHRLCGDLNGDNLHPRINPFAAYEGDWAADYHPPTVSSVYRVRLADVKPIDVFVDGRPRLNSYRSISQPEARQ